MTLGVEIAPEEAADYVGIDDPTDGQLLALDRLGRSAVEHVALHLNRDYPDAVPAPVEEACWRMLASLYEESPPAGSDASRHLAEVRVDDVTLKYGEPYSSSGLALPPPVRSLLAPYRLPPGL